MHQLEEIMRLTRQNYDRNVKLDGNYDMARKNSYVVMAERMNLPRQNLVLPKKTKWKNCGGTNLNLPFTAYWKLS